MPIATAKWTVHEYHQMIAAGLLNERQVELLQGEIIEMSPEGEPHAYFSSTAGEYLMQKLGQRAMVRPAKPITLSDHSEPEPDLAIVKRLGREYLSHHPYPENIFWLIEYSESSLEKDLELKRKLYASENIPEYWVVDIKLRQLVVFSEPQAGDYTTQATFTSGVLCSQAFPDVEIAVHEIVSPN
jgi:Uma2 family endonuclease